LQGRAKSGIPPLVAVLLGAALAAAGLPATGADEGDPRAVPLDRLLQLPSSLPVEGRVEKRGGNTKRQWQERFQKADDDLQAAQRALEESRAELEELASGESWTMSAPGLGAATAPTDSPLDYRLSQELKRQREELERAERQLQELEVEANLAGVPEEWRHPDAASPEVADPETAD
jgi:hypothetical protein